MLRMQIITVIELQTGRKTLACLWWNQHIKSNGQQPLGSRKGELLCTTDECNLLESREFPFKLLLAEEAGQLGRGLPIHLSTCTQRTGPAAGSGGAKGHTNEG